MQPPVAPYPVIAFWLSLASAGAMLAVLVWSILRPGQRLWPPQSGRAGPAFWLVWGLIGLLLAALLALGWLDAGSLGLGPVAQGIGGLLLLLGNALAWWGVAVLGGRATTGLPGQLATGGPYRFSRNPQYLGDILILIGVALLADSRLALLPCALGAACAALAPFAEEPWLRARLGRPYEAYCRRTPRFL